jgi:hypothetical protein
MANAAAPQLGQESLPDLGRSVSTTLASAREQVAKAMPLIDVPRHEAAIADLERRSSMADLWDDVASAEATLRELSEHRAEVERSAKWARTLEDAEAALLLLPDLTDEPEAAVEMLSDELAQLHALTVELAEWEVRQLAGDSQPSPSPDPDPDPDPSSSPQHTIRHQVRQLMSGEYDRCGATLSIVTGSGRVDPNPTPPPNPKPVPKTKR